MTPLHSLDPYIPSPLSTIQVRPARAPVDCCPSKTAPLMTIQLGPFSLYYLAAHHGSCDAIVRCPIARSSTVPPPVHHVLRSTLSLKFGLALVAVIRGRVGLFLCLFLGAFLRLYRLLSKPCAPPSASPDMCSKLPTRGGGLLFIAATRGFVGFVFAFVARHFIWTFPAVLPAVVAFTAHVYHRLTPCPSRHAYQYEGVWCSLTPSRVTLVLCLCSWSWG